MKTAFQSEEAVSAANSTKRFSLNSEVEGGQGITPPLTGDAAITLDKVNKCL